MNENVSDYFNVLDLRSIEDQLAPPPQTLIAALDRLADDGILKLTTTARPGAIIELLEQSGHRFNLRQWRERAWDIEVLGVETPAIADLRELEAPEPMEKVLLACARLASGEGCLARLPRVPVMLFPHLESRGLCWWVHEEVDQSALLMVRSDAN